MASVVLLKAGFCMLQYQPARQDVHSTLLWRITSCILIGFEACFIRYQAEHYKPVQNPMYGEFIGPREKY